MSHCNARPTRTLPRHTVILTGALCLSLTGCMHLEQRLRVARDGTVTAFYHYSFPEERLPTITAGQQVIDKWQGLRGRKLEHLNWVFNEELARKTFGGHGMSLDKYVVYSRDGRRHVELACTAGDGIAALRAGRFGDFALVAADDGNMALRVNLPEEPGADGGLATAELAQLRELCEGLRLRFEVTVPTRVLSATGTVTGKDTATWEFDAARDASFLEKQPVIELRFAGTGLDWD